MSFVMVLMTVEIIVMNQKKMELYVVCWIKFCNNYVHFVSAGSKKEKEKNENLTLLEKGHPLNSQSRETSGNAIF